MTRSFPADFLFGAATASYQIEGAATEDGRGPSIWDTFSHTPGRVLGGDTGDVAADHYHRMPEDVALMGELGLQAYRFSTSWSRVLPEGVGTINAAGLDFYKRLADTLRDNGIKPILTLYHWDLPEALQARGGWAARDTAYAFGDFAALMAREVGDRIEVWTTLNEPWCSAYLGHGSGVHAPGVSDPVTALTTAHHLNLAHGLGAQAVRAALPGAAVSLTLNVHHVRPADPSHAPDREVARRLDAVANRIFLDACLTGRYPSDLIEATASVTDWGFVHDGDAEQIHQPVSSLGVNYYTPVTVAHAQAPDEASRAELLNWPGVTDAQFVRMPGERTDMDWLVDPTGLTDLLIRLDEDYALPLLITENGAAYPDRVEADGAVRDADRTRYLHSHLSAVLDAIDRGADVRGYLVWSLLDNFEWAYGYRKRFGIVHVDYDTQRRTVKDSGRWYAAVCRDRVLPPHV